LRRPMPMLANTFSLLIAAIIAAIDSMPCGQFHAVKRGVCVRMRL
jgi:hypothetical protein